MSLLTAALGAAVGWLLRGTRERRSESHNTMAGGAAPAPDADPSGAMAVPRAERVLGGICEVIGETPLVELSRFAAAAGGVQPGCRLLGKLEFQKPGGSVNDRVARFVVEAAEARGEIQ